MNDGLIGSNLTRHSADSIERIFDARISKFIRNWVFRHSSFRTRVCLFVAILFPLEVFAEESGLRLTELERVPVLYNGRKMPLDSFARAVLLQFSGRQKIGDESAVSWLARTFFAPDSLSPDQIFLINHPHVLQSLAVEPRKRRRYSLADLHAGLPKLQEHAAKASGLEEELRSPVEKELIRIYGNVGMFLQLQSSFSFTFPHRDLVVQDDGLRKEMGFETEQDRSFLDIYGKAALLQPYLTSAQDMNDERAWTAKEREAFRLAGILFTQSRAHRNLAFTLIPVDPHGEEVWVSGWDALSLNLPDGALRKALLELGTAAAGYNAGDQVAFDMAIRSYRMFAESRIGTDRALQYMEMEVRMNRWNLFGRAASTYAFAFLLALFALLIPRRPLRIAGAGLILFALILHGSGIGMRMAVMGRPPVTNLYATFLFVGFLCVVLGLVVEWIQQNGLGLTVSSFSGFSLLLVAQRFFLDGDTMHQMVAVLDSNFWLSTHVIAVTTGYAGCFLAGVVGHCYLLALTFAPGNKERLASMYRAMMGILAFGLIFAFLGTMLGGVWADHSWGRFWGWDPKENGALLIVLWSAILFHARMGGMIRERGMAAGCVLGVIVVVTAWLGVNLLSVGLHSYGFTSGLAAGYYSVILFELLFVAILVPLAGGPTKSKGPPVPSD